MEYIESFEKLKNGIYIQYPDTPIWIKEWESNNSRVFSDVIEIEHISLKSKFVMFISCKHDEINYIARVRRDKNVVTKKTRVFFEKVVKLNPSIQHTKVIENLSPQMKTSYQNMSSKIICEITANQYNCVIGYLFETDKKQHALLHDIIFQKGKIKGNFEKEIEIKTYEKDAVNLCIRLADIDNQYNAIAEWDITATSTPDFLKTHSSVSLREDQMIINDFRCFGE